MIRARSTRTSATWCSARSSGRSIPEFINRIDEIIVFEALSDDDLRRIMSLLVEQLNANLVDRRMKIVDQPRRGRLDHRRHV